MKRPVSLTLRLRLRELASGVADLVPSWRAGKTSSGPCGYGYLWQQPRADHPLFPTVGESAPMPKDENTTKGKPASASPDLDRSALDVSPCANIHPKAKAYASVELPKEYDLKMEWICDNLPKMSKRRLIRDALRIHVDALIAMHYPQV
jgi:hypothetical protein